MSDIEKKIYSAIGEQFDKPIEELNGNLSFKDDLNADSLDLVELIMTLETELGIEADDSDLENIETIGDCIKFVEKSIN